MDARSILDQVLGSGKQLAAQTKDFAERQLGVPTSGPDREKMLAGLGKGAVAGGLLALLLGTRTGRKVTGKAVKYGSMAALAAVAYQAYQGWKARQVSTPSDAGLPMAQLVDEPAHHQSQVLLQAMIAAANADGHIDEQERAHIQSQLASLGLEPIVAQMLQREVDHPKNAREVAASVDSQAAAAEVYSLSTLIVDDANPMERQYLRDLAAALSLPNDLVEQLEMAVMRGDSI